MQAFIEILKKELPEKVLLLGEDIGERYHSDWSETTKLKPEVVLRPSTTEEVSTILKLCHKHEQKLVVQGGLTGLAGSGTPQAGEVSLSLERLVGIEEIDSDAMTMTVCAGTPLQTVQEAAREAGLLFPLDLGARGSANIGGNVSTNAGGTQVIRYGMIRNLILGLEVVLADGTIIRSLNKMLKNNAGYDLKQLFIGTEGTLGIVTRVVLRLYPLLSSTCTALCAFSNFESSIQFLKQANTRLVGSISSYEVMLANYYDYITQNIDNIRSPFDEQFPVYAILEAEGGNQEDDSKRFEEFLAEALECGLLLDATIAQSSKEAEEIWAIRHAIAEAIPMLEPLCNMDISVPISQMPAFLEKSQAELKSLFPKIDLFIFGHIGDSNIHYMGSTGRYEDKHAVEQTIYKLCQEFNGSISAEHGIGTIKKEFLPYSRTPEEIALMRKIKEALDPKQILNQGRIF